MQSAEMVEHRHQGPVIIAMSSLLKATSVLVYSTSSIGLRCQDSTGASVIVANGDRVACQGLAKDVAINISNQFFQINCTQFPSTAMTTGASSDTWSNSVGL